MSNLANHVLAVLYKNNLSINNLKLQKVMYFALSEYLNEISSISEMEFNFDSYFEAWTYGAVVPNDFHYFKKYGGASILEKGIYNENLSKLDESILKYKNYSTLELTRFNKELPFWLSHKDKILKDKKFPKYSLKDLSNDFKYFKISH